jgi:hypothetical protein
MAKIPFGDLIAENRILALQWMREGINKGIAMMCHTKAHHIFVQSLHGGPAFDPSAVWDAFEDSTHEHFTHGQTALAVIDSAIAAAENEIATRSAPVPPEVTREKPKAKPKPKPTPKKTTKKRPSKRGGKK